jgi:hypothetical protein
MMGSMKISVPGWCFHRYDRIVPRVMKAGYNGYWGMEFVPTGNAIAELRESIDLFSRLAG